MPLLRILALPEITAVIAEFLESPAIYGDELSELDVQRLARPCLFRAALISRISCESFIDTLWKTIFSLNPLCSLLDMDTSEDRILFTKYARRVRILHLDLARNDAVTMWNQLTSHFEICPVFPLLTKAVLQLDGRPYTPDLSKLIATSNLKSLECRWQRWYGGADAEEYNTPTMRRQIATGLLRPVLDQAPYIQELDLFDHIPLRITIEVLLSLHHLRHIHLDTNPRDFTWPEMETLMALPSIYDFHLKNQGRNMESSWSLHIYSKQVGLAIAAEMEIIGLLNGTAKVIENLPVVRSVSSLRLKTSADNGLNSLLPVRWGNFGTAFCTRFAHSTEKLMITDNSRWVDEVLGLIVRAFSPCALVSSFDFKDLNSAGVCVQESDLDLVAAVWPRLTHLGLYSQIIPYLEFSPATVSSRERNITAIPYFAQTFDHLTSLRLTVSYCIFAFPWVITTKSSLQILDINGEFESSDDDIWTVATYLVDCFPDLRQVTFGGNSIAEFNDALRLARELKTIAGLYTLNQFPIRNTADIKTDDVVMILKDTEPRACVIHGVTPVTSRQDGEHRPSSHAYTARMFPSGVYTWISIYDIVEVVKDTFIQNALKQWNDRRQSPALLYQ